MNVQRIIRHVVLKLAGMYWMLRQRSGEFVAKLDPLRDLEHSRTLFDGGVWRATGTDPTFRICSPKPQLPRGWIELSGCVQAREGVAVPKLYVDRGRGEHERGVKIFQTHRHSGQFRRFAFIPPDVIGLRWDPIDHPGEFFQGRLRWRLVPWREQIALSSTRLTQAVIQRVVRLIPGHLTRFHAPDRIAPGATYRTFLSAVEANTHAELAGLTPEADEGSRFAIVLLVDTDRPHSLRQAILAIDRQLASAGFIVVIDPGNVYGDAQIGLEAKGVMCASSLQTALERIPESIERVILARASAKLSSYCVISLSHEVRRFAEQDVFYWDHDYELKGRRQNPWLKPQWDPFYARQLNFLLGSVCFRLTSLRSAVERYEGCSVNPLLESQLVERIVTQCHDVRVRHLPVVLTHFLERRLPKPTHMELQPPARWPKVTIIVPTRDGGRVLKRCVQSVLRRTNYPNFELLIVNNDSRDRRTLSFLQHLRSAQLARVMDYPQPFNFSAINNQAAHRANGDYLVFLNDDTQVRTPDWLMEMMRIASREDVGAVGAKLFYPNGRIQHAGVVVGLGGVAGHPYCGVSGQAKGYLYSLKVTKEVTAVTAACMCVSREYFHQVGGFDDKKLKVAFNDVDLCLKLRQLGLKNVWTPHAQLFHYESYSRGKDLQGEKAKRFQQEVAVMRARWRTLTFEDPFFHIAFTRDDESGTLSINFEPYSPAGKADGAIDFAA